MSNTKKSKAVKSRRAGQAKKSAAEPVGKRVGALGRASGAPPNGVAAQEFNHVELIGPGLTDVFAPTIETQIGQATEGATGRDRVDIKGENVIIPAVVAKEVDSPGGPCGPDSAARAKRLVQLKFLILADLRELSKLLTDAVARKIQLGEHLAEARDYYRSRRGEWEKFLKVISLKDRSAREAIAFYRNRAIIEGMRHGRAAIAVEEVRLALAKPKPRVGVSPVDPPGADEPRGRSSIPASGAGQVEESIGPLVPEVLPLGGPSDDPPAVVVENPQHSQARNRPGAAKPPTSAVAPRPPTDEELESNSYVGYFEGVAEMADELIEELEAGEHESIIEPLRSGVQILLVALDRLGAALEAIDRPGRSGQSG
jgi:hypothetical protein